MSITLDSFGKIISLKSGIEATTGETYNDLTLAVQALKDGYGGSGGSGEDTRFDEMVMGTLSSVSDNKMRYIGQYAFYGQQNLTDVQFLACLSIWSYAFAGCSLLSSISFPVCTSIDTSAFQNCNSLVNIEFPLCNTIGLNAF